MLTWSTNVDHSKQKSNEKVSKVSKTSDLSRELRKALGDITQAELATRLLVSRNYISQIEAELKTPSDRLEAAMRRMLTEAAKEGKVSTGVEEPTSDVASAAAMRAEVIEHLAVALASAGTSPARIGWVLEQVRTHLRPPLHWRLAAGALEAAEADLAALKTRVAEGRPTRAAERIGM